MYKIKCFLLFLFASHSISAANDSLVSKKNKWSIAIKGGTSLTYARYEWNLLSRSNWQTPYLGHSEELIISRTNLFKRFDIGFGLGYLNLNNQFKYKATAWRGPIEVIYHYHFISIPIKLSIGFGNKKALRFGICADPSYFIKMIESYKSGGNENNSIHKIDSKIVIFYGLDASYRFTKLKWMDIEPILSYSISTELITRVSWGGINREFLSIPTMSINFIPKFK